VRQKGEGKWGKSSPLIRPFPLAEAHGDQDEALRDRVWEEKEPSNRPKGGSLKMSTPGNCKGVDVGAVRARGKGERLWRKRVLDTPSRVQCFGQALKGRTGGERAGVVGEVLEIMSMRG